MTLNKPIGIKDPTLGAILDEIASKALTVKITDVEPTSTTAAEGELIIFEGTTASSGTATVKQLYVLTGKGNLGYLGLT